MTHQEAMTRAKAISQQLHAAESEAQSSLAKLMSAYASAIEWSVAQGVPAYSSQKTHKSMQATLESGFADLSKMTLAHERIHRTFTEVMGNPLECPDFIGASKEGSDNIVNIIEAA